MPSPFPGMDPYLEHPLLWPTFQQYFLGTLADLLAEVLPRRFQAQIKERVFLQNGPETEPLVPGTPATNCIFPVGSLQAVTSNHVPSAVHPVWHIPTAPEEVRENYLEIVLAGEPAQLLTVIEFLTLGNKTPQCQARERYLAHRRSVLAAGPHLMEIDLLRAGQHTVFAPQQRILRRGRYHYLVSLCRAGRRDFCEVWGIPLAESLPRVAVPLPEGQDLVLDLQSLFSRCYDDGGFARQVDYEHDPFFPLGPADSRWAEGVLQQQGLRV